MKWTVPASGTAVPHERYRVQQRAQRLDGVIGCRSADLIKACYGLMTIPISVA
jgi:hypothetical protein